MFRGFIPINLPVRLFVCAPVGASSFMGNWVENIKREDFIKIKKNFNIFIFIVLQCCWGAEFIIKESLLK